jgi:lipid-A-disaccharide synthase
VFNRPNLVVVIPTLARLQDCLVGATASWPLPVHIVTTHQDKIDTFAAAQAALAASGTVVLETALAGLPTVMGYRVHPVTAWIARRLVITPFASLPNIIAERGIVPEFLQQDCEPERLHDALLPLFRDRHANKVMRDELRSVRQYLTPAQAGIGAGAQAAVVLRRMLAA